MADFVDLFDLERFELTDVQIMMSRPYNIDETKFVVTAKRKSDGLIHQVACVCQELEFITQTKEVKAVRDMRQAVENVAAELKTVQERGGDEDV